MSRDEILHLLNVILIEAELKMALDNNTDTHHFANTVFNRMLDKLVTEEIAH